MGSLAFFVDVESVGSKRDSRAIGHMKAKKYPLKQINFNLE